jgi:hypothetical protein
MAQSAIRHPPFAIANLPHGRSDNERPEIRPIPGFIHADENCHAAQYSEWGPPVT